MVQLLVGLSLFIIIEILHVYDADQATVQGQVHHFVEENLFWLRTIAVLIFIIPALNFLVLGTSRQRVLTAVILVLTVVFTYWINR